MSFFRASTSGWSAHPSAVNRRVPTIVTVARLEDRYKGFDVTTRALPLIRARVPNARWVVVGEGSLRAELEALTRSEGVADWVTFTGSVDDATRDAWLEKSDVFVMPSRLVPGSSGGEGFGIVSSGGRNPQPAVCCCERWGKHRRGPRRRDRPVGRPSRPRGGRRCDRLALA